MRLGGELKKERRLRKMDQVQAAAAMGVSQQTVSKWENGGRPDHEHLKAIATFLRREIDDVAVLAYAEPEGPPASMLEQRLQALELTVAAQDQKLDEILRLLRGAGGPR